MDARATLALAFLGSSARSKLGASVRELTAERPSLGGDAFAHEILARLDLSPGQFGDALRRATVALDDAQRKGVAIVAWRDAAYPALLAHIYDPPVLLWVRGSPALLDRGAVALVGARAASPGGLEAAGELAYGLATRGVVVVSGLARGIDSAAHRGALEAGGTTVAVLGSGVDRVYPPEHGELASRIAAHGALASEFPPGTPPLRGHFPLRNRIISGLCRAVVVVEAAERSGSLITARCALEQGREVMAVPGSSTSGRNRGAHGLIRDGAKLVETVDDILEELPDLSTAGSVPEMAPKCMEEKGLSDVMPPGEACSLDELAARSQLDPTTLLRRLLEMELDGRVTRSPGGRFVRTTRRVVT
jgi:DNA processing protein